MGHREEHVKRSRITYDCNGGQTPSISPRAISIGSGTDARQQVCDPAISNATPKVSRSIASSHDTNEDSEADKTPEVTLTSWLFDKASKVLFG